MSESDRENSSSRVASTDLSRETGSDTCSNTSCLASNGHLPKPLILVVDDLPENLATLSAMVSEDGADVRVANAGPVALRYARLAPQPDLILLDIMMPGMDGRAVLAELLKDPQTAHIPVIFVTALGDAERVQLRQSSGKQRLDEAALEAVRHWRFVPARRGEQAVAAWVQVPITFQLES